MNQYLFVYGTLMAGLDSGPGQLLATNAAFVSEGWLHGFLYDLGKYPGAIYDPKAESKVLGHIYLLPNAPSILAFLDQYEGYDARFAAQCEYLRTTCPVNTNGEETLNCQVYTYQGSITEKKLIPSGNYLAYLEQNSNHQDFIKSTKLN